MTLLICWTNTLDPLSIKIYEITKIDKKVLGVFR